VNGREFYKKVSEHRALEWLGAREGAAPEADEILIANRTTGKKLALRVSAIAEHSWDDLEAALIGGRPLRIMSHLTRIVGYFSQVQNWNKSKLAELADRRKGLYMVAEPAAPAAPVEMDKRGLPAVA